MKRETMLRENNSDNEESGHKPDVHESGFDDDLESIGREDDEDSYYIANEDNFDDLEDILER